MPPAAPPEGAVVIEGHVQGLAVTRSLGEHGIPVVVVDVRNCLARYSRYTRGYFRCPPFRSDEFADFLLDLGERQGLNGWTLFPSNDFAVHTLARNRGRLMRVFRLITPPLPVVERIYNKRRTFEIAAACDVPFPVTVYPGDGPAAQDAPGFPAIVKGIEGLSFYKSLGRKTLLVHDPAELRATLDEVGRAVNLRQVMVQEVLPFDPAHAVTSFTSFAVDGRIRAHWVGAKVREHPARFGTATCCESVDVPELYPLAERLLAEIGYTGVSEIEFLRDPRDGRFKLIEINARTWLWVSLARRCGVDYALMIYRHVHGLEQNFPDGYDIGVRWVHLATDMAFGVKAVLSRKLRPDELVRSYRGPVEWAVLSRTDPRPFAAELLLLPYLALVR
jgi:D-aspartate ligase